MRLTPVGEGIVAQAQKVLEQAQGIRELAQAGKNQLTAPLKVGAIYTVGPYLFPHLIPQLHRVAPQMPLYIEENFTHVLRDKLRNGELDAIIIALPFNEADVLTLPLYDEPFYVLMPAEHPDPEENHRRRPAQRQEPAAARRRPLLPRPGARSLPDPDQGQRRRQAHHGGIQLLETIRHMVASGLGISILPLSAVDSHHYSWRDRSPPADATRAVPHRCHRLARQFPATQGHRNPRRLDPPVLRGQAARCQVSRCHD